MSSKNSVYTVKENEYKKLEISEGMRKNSLESNVQSQKLLDKPADRKTNLDTKSITKKCTPTKVFRCRSKLTDTQIAPNQMPSARRPLKLQPTPSRLEISYRTTRKFKDTSSLLYK